MNREVWSAHIILFVRIFVKEKVKNLTLKLHPKRVSTLFETFLKDESIGGKLILVAALLSLIVVNSPLRDEFDHFWHTTFSLGIGSWGLALDLRHWVNEGLMAFFFLVVGLEIKREFVKGELKNKKTAILPIGAAVGGMMVPAVIYVLFNINTDAVQGWGIPIATDIAIRTIWPSKYALRRYKLDADPSGVCSQCGNISSYKFIKTPASLLVLV
jgi:hypothetical protein